MWPFSIESIHPLVVHFPIALLLVAVGFDLAAMMGQWPALHRVALWNLGLGALGAGAAVWTGLEASEAAKHTFDIYKVMQLHRKLGISTLILSGLLLVWRLFTCDRFTLRARLLMLPLMLAMVGTVSYGAYLGGRLVYEFGAAGPFDASQTPRSDTLGAPSH